MEKAVRDWACQECGKLMTLRQAERAADKGCTRCGGVDVDMRVSGSPRDARDARSLG